MSYYLSDGAHVLIAGATGAGDEYGGKSVLANWWYQQSVLSGWHELGLFFDPKGLRYVSNADGVRSVSTLRGLAESYRSGARLFQFHPTGGDVQEQHEAVVEMLRQLPGKKIVAHDEAQSYDESAGLDWCLSQGGNMEASSDPTGDIRSLVLTQRPWNLSEELRANMPLKIWVGPFGNEAEHFFDVERMTDAKQKVQERTGPYYWSVTDAGDFVETNPPVPEEYAE